MKKKRKQTYQFWGKTLRNYLLFKDKEKDKEIIFILKIKKYLKQRDVFSAYALKFFMGHRMVKINLI